MLRKRQAGLQHEVISMTNDERDKLLVKIDKELGEHVARCEALTVCVEKHEVDLNGNGKEGLKSQVAYLRRVAYATATMLLVLLGAVAKGLAERWL